MIRRCAIRAVLACLTLALAACIDVREELWLENDGSARLEAHYELPTRATLPFGGPNGLRDRLVVALRQHPHIERFDCQVHGDNARTRLDVTMETTDLRALQASLGNLSPNGLPDGISGWIGNIDIHRRGLAVDVERRLDPGSATPALKWVPRTELDGHQLVYIVHLPDAAIDSNATDIWNDGRSLLWEIPLADAIRGPQVTRFRIPLPIPWLPVSLATAAIVVAAGAWSLRRHLKHRNSS